MARGNECRCLNHAPLLAISGFQAAEIPAEHWLWLCRSAELASQQQIARAIHQLHRVVLTSAIGMMLTGAALPGLVDLGFCEPAGSGQMQALAGDDRIEIGVLAHRSPVGLAQRLAALAAALALAASGRFAPAKALLAAARLLAVLLWLGAAGDQQGGRPLKGGLGHQALSLLSSMEERLPRLALVGPLSTVDTKARTVSPAVSGAVGVTELLLLSQVAVRDNHLAKQLPWRGLLLRSQLGQ